MSRYMMLKELYFVPVVTNEVPDQPVISPLSGAIFERRIIEKYLIENGCDPITGKEMKVEELIEVKGKVYSIFAQLFSF